MSDVDESQAELEIASNTDEKPAPKKKTARKRATKKAAAKKQSPSGDTNDESIPEVFSASPDDVDDYGDVSERESRIEQVQATDKAVESKTGDDEKSHTGTHESEDTSSGKTGGDDPAKDDQSDQGRPNKQQHERRNKFERFKGKKDRQQNFQNNPNQGGGKQKFNKKNKKARWQSAPGFAAAADEDVEPPVFDSLTEWDIFKEEEKLAAFIEENIDASSEPLDYNSLAGNNLQELEALAKENDVTWDGLPSRPKILRAFLDHARSNKQPVKVCGIVEILETGYGFIVFERDNLRLKTDSPFLSGAIIKRLGIQRGHRLEVIVSGPKDNETCPFVVSVDSVMGKEPEVIQHLTPFTDLTPYYPTERIVLESAEGALGKWDNISMRVVDLLSPVGLGQRGLIVAPPRTGKTVLLQGIANAIRVNKPKVKLIILLVDERPEEVTDFKRSVKGAEVIASTFDESAESHVHAAEMVIEKSRRLVESGEDVIILLDSITRLARAYNTLMPSSGKILSGGVEASALQKPKRFFGSARNIEEGGSLTILGTALVDTGSKMDEVIFEEFKGTGNMELHLDRELSNKRVFPALSFERSGTRKEELLYHPDEMAKVYGLRRAMKGVPSVEAMEMLISRIKKTKTNAEFLMGMAR